MGAEDAMVARAAAALIALEATMGPAEPLRLVIHRIVGALDGARPVPPLFEFLEGRVAGSPRSESRYRWELTHRVGVKLPGCAATPSDWTAWRAGEADALARDPFEVEARLLVPLLLTENLELLLDAAAARDPICSPACRGWRRRRSSSASSI